jgi:hypothetical protein
MHPSSLALSLLAALAALAAGQSPPSVRDQFDCLMRNYAVEFAQAIQPFRSAQVFSDIADALAGSPEKASGCNVTFTPAQGQAAQAASRFPHLHATPKAPAAGGATLYVSLSGSDATGTGALAAPFATLARALQASRATPGADTIVLRGGVYARQATIVLGPADSGLTITNFPGEEVWLSGGTPLAAATAAQWKAYNVSGSPAPPPAPSPQWLGPFNNTTDVYANAGGAALLQKTPTWAACQALCQGKSGCQAWTWHDANQGSYALDCFWRPDGVWAPQAEAGHVAGYFGLPPAPPPAPNVWSLALPGVTSVLGLRASDGSRLTRARFPNGFPETRGFMPPAVFRASSWTPQSTPRAPATQVDLPRGVLSRNTSVDSFQTFTAGIGGTCDRFQPAAGYWCSEHVQGGGSVIYYIADAMQATTAVLPHLPYKDPRGGIMQVWRPGHWCSHMYEISDYSFDGVTANFSLPFGGFQGSRGDDAGEDSYIEGVFEELDFPSEWFFDPAAATLYLWHNATSGTPPPLDLVMTSSAFKHIFNITGTQATPVVGVTIQGLGFRDTAYTYMDPHSIPSGGDWTLERSAVVFIEGTEGTNVTGCVFERIDGNAVLLSAYNRNVSVTHNEFAWIGSTAVALWGNTESSGSGNADAIMPEGYGADGTAGNQPRFSLIAYNLCRELGIWEKQSSCYTQFKSAQNTVWRNIMYNGPRAHINFNDGFGGGALVDGNLVFNSCRESSDHGPFNVRCRRGGGLCVRPSLPQHPRQMLNLLHTH